MTTDQIQFFFHDAEGWIFLCDFSGTFLQIHPENSLHFLLLQLQFPCINWFAVKIDLADLPVSEFFSIKNFIKAIIIPA